MKRSILLLVSLFLLSVVGVDGQRRADFPYVSVPGYISNEGGVMEEWMALHFWDKYDFASCETNYEKAASREGFVAFLRVLRATSLRCSAEAVGTMMARAAVGEESYWYFLEMAEEVLYDPLSPLREDLLWEHFLRHAVGKGSPLDEVSKGRYRMLLELVCRNQRGMVATDFTYTLADGATGRLHDIEAPYTLLWFYNPGCGECARIKARIAATGYLEMLYSVGAVEVLALYPDEELEAWRGALGENPSWWITAYDKEQTIRHQNIYDLKAIPTIYLLDAQKRVVLKDPDVEVLLGVLEKMIYGE